jgi:SOS response regulatory protein OraA/RecX
MAALTALRKAGPGRIALEVDGRPWRTVPAAVVARAGLVEGLELDRPTLRRVRSELVRGRALGIAGRALARRELSTRELDGRLARAGVAPAVAEDVREGLVAVGAVDDARYARTAAESLARRGWGDTAIEVKLDAAGVGCEALREAIDGLEPEPERARAAVRGERDPRRAAARLVRRGFSQESVEQCVGAALDWDA